MQLSHVLAVAALHTVAVGATASPIAKVLTMLSDLEQKVVKEGEGSQKEFAAFSEWCEDRSRNLGFEIKTGKAEVEELKAAIARESASTMSLNEKVEELAAGIATDEADLKAATQIRTKEAADFAAEEKELIETVDILHRAIAILEREMAKGGASMLQSKSVGSLTEALSAMVEASVIGTSDAAKLTAFVQSRTEAAEDEDEPGAPAGAVYQSKSGNIVDTLEGLLDKADEQLDATRKSEVNARHNYEMLKQSLEDEIAYANKDLDAAKKGIAGSAETKATAEGDLEATAKELASDEDVKETLHHDCMTRSADFQAETQSRGEELKALAQAKKLISEATDSGASFLQVDAASGISSGVDLANFEAVRLVRDLARKEHSQVLAQLAKRMAAVMRASSNSGADPFEKVKGLITDMIAKLEQEAGASATKKAYCDKELKETNQKKLEKTTEIEMLGTRIEQASAKSAKLKEEVATLENELSKLAKGQAEADKLRAEEKDAFEANKAEQEKGLEGVRAAVQVLKEYYAQDDAAHDASTGAAGGIIGLLETIESDFTKTLAALMTEEDSAVEEYETMTRRNEIEKATKDSSVKYKTKESKDLDKASAENVADRNGVQAELDAVLEYLAKMEEQCIAKAETYAERTRRREAEIAGLKQALEILESETALIQSKMRPRTLRGVHRH